MTLFNRYLTKINKKTIVFRIKMSLFTLNFNIKPQK